MHPDVLPRDQIFQAEAPAASAEEEIPSIPEMAAAAEAPKAEEPPVQLDENFFTAQVPSMSALRERMRQEMHKPEAGTKKRGEAPPAAEPSVEESIRSAMEELQVDRSAAVYDDDEATRVINLDDLQFGRNYKRGE